MRPCHGSPEALPGLGEDRDPRRGTRDQFALVQATVHLTMSFMIFFTKKSVNLDVAPQIESN